MSKRSFNPFKEPARGSRPLAQKDALLDSASAAKKGTNHVPLFHHQQQALTVIQTAFQDRDQHIATLQDEFEALSMTNYQYVQTLEDRDNTITSLQQQLQDHEIVAKQLADRLEDIKQHDDRHKQDHKTIVVLEAGLENLRAKYEKVLEKNHVLKQDLEKSENAVAETEVDKEQVAKWRSECDAARKYVKENKEFKTVNTELRALLDAATAAQSKDKKQLRIVELVRIKQMYEREIKELRSTVELTQATTTQPSQDEATEKIKTLEAQLRAAQDDARTKIAELAARYHTEQDEMTKKAVYGCALLALPCPGE
ncbi:MAG: Methylenetetrahydrofolate dehydrogenase [Aureobasidium pullulans]|nr:MAG: Methylenetetrahydrofolate dehydrogenase [Aureobasidium pullulans]